MERFGQLGEPRRGAVRWGDEGNIVWRISIGSPVAKFGLLKVRKEGREFRPEKETRGGFEANWQSYQKPRELFHQETSFR